MPSESFSTHSIATREQTAALLRSILRDEVDAEDVLLNFREATWVNFHLNLKGFHYESTLDSGVMSSLVEYQNTLYRLAAYVNNGHLNGNALTDKLKSRLELSFKVTSGSSEVKAEWWQALGAMVSDVTGGMGTKAKLVLVLSLSLIIGGGLTVEKAIDAYAEVKKEEIKAADHAQEMALIQNSIAAQAEVSKLLAEATKAQPSLGVAQTQFQTATSEIIRRSSRADMISIQGVTISGASARTLTATKRQASQDITIEGTFTVFDINSKDPDTFHCQVERNSDQLVIHAGMYDALLSEQAKEVIYTAFRERKNVKLKIAAKLLRGQYNNSRILTAEIVEDEVAAN